MIELSLTIVEPEEQRADPPALALVTEAADDAIGRTHAFHLEHGALAGLVGAVEAFRHDAVEPTAAAREPARGLGMIARHRREPERRGMRDVAIKALERG